MKNLKEQKDIKHVADTIIDFYNSYYKEGHQGLYSFFIEEFTEAVPQYIYNIQPTYSHVTLGKFMEIQSISIEANKAKVEVLVSIYTYTIIKTIYLEKKDDKWMIDPENLF